MIDPRNLVSVFLLWLASLAAVQAQVTIHVHLIYLNNGKPAAGQQVVLYEGDPQHMSPSEWHSQSRVPKALTSSEGTAVFQIHDPLPNTVEVNVGNGRIRGCAMGNQLPLDLVIKQGVTIGVDARFGSSCKGDRSLLTRFAAKPGEIVIFVRKQTAWDNLREY